MSDDPALGLLEAAPTGEGRRVLLLGCAGSPALIEKYAARYGEVLCHADLQPAAAAVRDGGPVRVILGDQPCWAERPAGTMEDFLPEHRFPEGHFDRIVMRLGRGTASVNSALLESFRMLKVGGDLLAAAANQEGIKSFAKRAELHFGSGAMLALKHSCRLLRFLKNAPQPSDSIEDPGYYRSLRHTLAHPAGETAYRTKPGVFAYRGTDAGTALLARHVPDCTGLRVLDLCCGSGALGLAAFARGAADVLALDASATAIACGARNFAEAGLPGRVLCADAASAPAGQFDLVLANPPFHEGAATDYTLPARMIECIASALRDGGEAWVVANQFLDYAKPARARFPTVEIAARADGYLIHHMVLRP
ncbi:MAG: methyltransferase [Fibrobacteres bacterium]|nr:methyltransferase [Fibrobacterota bacterium]